MKNIFAEKDKDFERRNHGCDGCRIQTATERFDGYCGGHLWLCSKCYRRLVKVGLGTTLTENEKDYCKTCGKEIGLGYNCEGYCSGCHPKLKSMKKKWRNKNE